MGKNTSHGHDPESTKTSLGQRLVARARERWPQIHGIVLRFRGPLAYIDAQLIQDGEPVVEKLCWLRYGGSAHIWGFAIYRASHDDCGDSVLPTGLPVGSAEEALDTACGLYLGDPTAWA